jgi:CTP synthase
MADSCFVCACTAKSHVISLPNVSSIYSVPKIMFVQKMDRLILKQFQLSVIENYFQSMWVDTVEKKQLVLSAPVHQVISVTIVGKYTKQKDSYLSISHALTHACAEFQKKLEIHYVDAETLIDKKQCNLLLQHSQAILIPGGFGERGVEGMVLAAEYARNNKIPFLGICLGFQVAVIEWARNVFGFSKAHSTEFDEKTPHPVVIAMPELNQAQKGGTMRLGLRVSKIVDRDSFAYRAYKTDTISERHRHRYEVNPAFLDMFKAGLLRFTATAVDEPRMEILELHPTAHPFYVATQFHPEFLSRPCSPSPLFAQFIAAINSIQDQAGDGVGGVVIIPTPVFREGKGPNASVSAVAVVADSKDEIVK